MQRDESLFYDSLSQLENSGYKVYYLWNWASIHSHLSLEIPQLFGIFGPEGMLFLGIPSNELESKDYAQSLIALKAYSEEIMELLCSIEPRFQEIAHKIRLWIPKQNEIKHSPLDANSGYIQSQSELSQDLDSIFVSMRSPGAQLLAELDLHPMMEQLEFLGCQCVPRAQFRPLDYSSQNLDLHSMLLEGGPGTGKTVQMINHAQSALRAGKKTLVLCYNRPLHAYLKRELGHFPGSVVLPILSYCDVLSQKICMQNTMDTEDLQEDPAYWSETLPQKALEYLKHKSPSFECICIDEAQDLRHRSWWDVLKQSVHANAKWIIAWDPGQGIYLSKNKPDQIEPSECFPLGLEPKHLTTNYRNHKKITAELNRSRYWKLHSAYHDQRLSGGHIEYLQCSKDPKAWQRALQAILSSHNPSPGSVIEPHMVVLGPRRFENSVFAQCESMNFGEFEIANEKGISQFHPRLIPYYTVHRFKGLEAEKVILLGFGDRDRNETMHRLFYLGISRARSDIWVIDP